MNGDIVASNDRLRRQVEILFAQIDRSHARPRVRPVNPARLVQERHQDIKTARRHAVETAEPLNQHHGRLRHDLNGLDRNDQQHQADKKEEEKQQDCSYGYSLSLQKNQICKCHRITSEQSDFVVFGVPLYRKARCSTNFRELRNKSISLKFPLPLGAGLG